MTDTLQIGWAFPARVVTNEELCAAHPDWSPERIFAKTGVASRHVAAPDETALDLAVRACADLFARGVDPAAVDYILFCTQSPICRLPSMACLLQRDLGLGTAVGALDVGLGCSGFVYCLSLAKGLIASGAATGVLVVTADTYTKYLAPDDRATRAIFGDAAAATFVDADVANRLGAFVIGTDGRGAERLMKRAGAPLVMDGPEIFNFTLDVVPPALDEICRRNALGRDAIDLYVLHQANRFMLETIRRVAAIDSARLYVDIADIGNTVSSSIPIALRRAEECGALRPVRTIALLGFGVGLSWCGTILRKNEG